LGSCFIIQILFKFGFKFTEIFKFLAHPALWAPKKDQIIFADTMDLTPSIGLGALLIYVYFLASLSNSRKL
jgi:hypothetical protein